jgi:hypothetical protein
MANLLSNNFKKASWKTVVDADAEYNLISNAIASYKATQGIVAIDDYAGVNSIMNREWEDPGPKVPPLDIALAPSQFRDLQYKYDYSVKLRKEVVSSNKAIADAKAACHMMHAKGVVIFDLAFTPESTIGQYKLRMMEETAEAWSKVSDTWIDTSLQMGVTGDVPRYLQDTTDILAWIKMKFRKIEADNMEEDGWAREHVEEFENLEFQASPIFHYRELRQSLGTFATGQSSMFATYTQNWNANTDIGQTLTGWITKENRYLMLLAKSGGSAMTAAQIDQHITHALFGVWGRTQFQALISDGLANPLNRELTWAGESTRITKLALSYPVQDAEMLQVKPGGIMARGVRTDDVETHVGEKRKGTSMQERPYSSRPPDATYHCKRCDSIKHTLRDCNATACYRCGAVIPCVPGDKRTYHDATTCTPKTGYRPGGAGAGGRTRDSRRGGRGRGGHGTGSAGDGASAAAVPVP